MDGIRQRLRELAQRYKYVVLVVLAGIFLMMIPGGEDSAETSAPHMQSPQPELDAKLEQILTQMDGVGRVRVMLTQLRGEQTVYICDEDRAASSDSESNRKEAVLITGPDRSQSGLITQIIAPVYQGAIVVCQGGDQPAVRLQVVEAVCDVTGLSADKVTVLKMK